eukprot:TRINITY_DN65202_c0_g1_i1.p1 TRINITY_DN65202_c0_g1~~TRINITY_DN65202_c0_g1_i1.p1  ORF type:complete len:370 (-),score=67.77 TRINITY_DN65202_c0_g1_i1:75-1184(-)
MFFELFGGSQSNAWANAAGISAAPGGSSRYTLLRSSDGDEGEMTNVTPLVVNSYVDVPEYRVRERVVEVPRLFQEEVIRPILKPSFVDEIKYVPRKEVRFVNKYVEVPAICEVEIQPSSVITALKVPVAEEANEEAPKVQWLLASCLRRSLVILAAVMMLLAVLFLLVWSLRPQSDSAFRRAALTPRQSEKVDTMRTSAPFDCDAGFQNWKKGWSSAKKRWCCSELGVACEQDRRHIEASSAPYDCYSGDDLRSWSSGKKLWCCHESNIACSTTAAPYNCHGDLRHRATWPPEQKDFCCAHFGVLCDHHGSSYDCQAGVSNFDRGWSDAKKSYCCLNEGIACMGSEPPAGAPSPGVRDDYARWTKSLYR